MHTHVLKAEDIINRGGATLIVELFGSGNAGGFAEDRGGVVWLDGFRHHYQPGEKPRLAPGESVTLRPGDWHVFWGEGGDVLIGEVSTVNDDETDNIFRDPIGRFAEIQKGCRSDTSVGQRLFQMAGLIDENSGGFSADLSQTLIPIAAFRQSSCIE